VCGDCNTGCVACVEGERDIVVCGEGNRVRVVLGVGYRRVLCVE